MREMRSHAESLAESDRWQYTLRSQVLRWKWRQWPRDRALLRVRLSAGCETRHDYERRQGRCIFI